MTVLRVAEAQAAILHRTARQPSLRLPLADALGHRLAEPVVAPWPLPMWTAASMDGYAVHAADVRGASTDAPITLTLAGGGDAGDGEPPPLQPGTAWRVATGGRVPSGADSVVRQEDTEQDETEHGTRDTEREDGVSVPHPASRVTIINDRDLQRNVRPAGGDVAKGEVVLQAGTLVHPGVLAMLAALGEAAPMVHRKPRVAILTSGNEVASLDQIEQISSGARIADVNAPMLEAMVREAGGVPVVLGLVADDPGSLAATIGAATDTDLVLTAGGISVGQMDHIVAVMERLSAQVVFRRVALRPGGPTTFALLPNGIPWLALPGNPVSAFVTFHLFAEPAIRQMAGEERTPAPPGEAAAGANARPAPRNGGGGGRTVTARLREPVARDQALDLYLRVTLEPANDGGPPWARLTGNQGSWVLSSIVAADGLALVEAGDGETGSGAEVGVISLVTGDR